MEAFIGQIIMFGGNFAPRGWALCDGQLLAISSNSALFSILGTTYGGDGRSTFGLPDLRGRAAIHPGNGPGLSNYRLGEKGGVENVTLTTAQIPSHDHGVTVAEPKNGGLVSVASSDSDQKKPLPGGAIGKTGGGQGHENRQPYQCVNYIIALQGTYPSRN